jgi:hypothetical protein
VFQWYTIAVLSYGPRHVGFEKGEDVSTTSEKVVAQHAVLELETFYTDLEVEPNI